MAGDLDCLCALVDNKTRAYVDPACKQKVKNTLRVESFKLADSQLFVRRLACINGWGDGHIALTINQIFHQLANFTASNHSMAPSLI
jgi:hypothetical protein